MSIRVRNGFSLELHEERPGPLEVYLRDGQVVDDPAEAETSIPIQEVLRYPLDADGDPTTEEQAVLVLEQEFDQQGLLRRTCMKRAASLDPGTPREE